MKTLIVYASSTGTVEKCAKQLAELLPGAELHALEKKGNPSPEGYDAVIVGGCIRGGGLAPFAQMYLEECEEMLLKKQLGLFICCGDDERADEYFAGNVSEELLNHAVVRMSFGGELDAERAKGIIDRMLVKSMAQNPDAAKMSFYGERIPEFASKMLANA